MPSKNTIKTYVENGFYHLYNRGVEKRNIFLDKQDCIIFLRFLKQYLCPKDELKMLSGTGLRLDRLVRVNMSEDVELLSFALMPNHFHLLVKQFDKNAISIFMKRLSTAYSMYFNKKYERVGPLFQGIYKGSIILDDSYVLHLSKYIHLNPSKLGETGINFNEFSSYPYYLGTKHAAWVKPEFVLSYFSEQGGVFGGTYEEFVEEEVSSEEVLGELTLE